MHTSNNRFFYQRKIFKNIWTILTKENVNNIGAIKFGNIQFFNIVETRFAKLKVSIIMTTTIKTQNSESQ